MKYLVVLFAFALATGNAALAQEQSTDIGKVNPASQASQGTWQGYLVDAKTAAEFAKNAETAMKNAAEYARTTALNEENSASGFGIYTGEKWLKFDEAGDKQARELVRNSRTEKGIMITVSGSLVGEQIAVTTIGEYATRKAPQRY